VNDNVGEGGGKRHAAARSEITHFPFQRMLHLVDFSLTTAPLSGSRPAGPEFESIGGERTGCGHSLNPSIADQSRPSKDALAFHTESVSKHGLVLKTETKLESPSARERQAAATAPCFQVQCSERSHDCLGLPLKCTG